MDVERLQKNGALRATGSYAHAPQVEEGSRSPLRNNGSGPLKCTPPFPGCLGLRKIATTDASGNRFLNHGGGDCRRVVAPDFRQAFRCRSARKGELIFMRGQHNSWGRQWRLWHLRIATCGGHITWVRHTRFFRGHNGLRDSLCTYRHVYRLIFFLPFSTARVAR